MSHCTFRLSVHCHSKFLLGYSAHEICKGGCPCLKENLIHKVECRTENGIICEFPFKAHGKIYTECTDDYNNSILSSEDKKYWCATKVLSAKETILKSLIDLKTKLCE